MFFQSESSTLQSYNGYPQDGKYGIICNISTPSGSYNLHRHNYIEIEYLTKGTIIHELNGFSETLVKGNCYGLSFRDFHKFSVQSNVEFHNICINPQNVSPEVRDMMIQQKFPFRANLDNKAFEATEKYFMLLYNELLHPCRFSSEKISAYTLLILSEIFSFSNSISHNEDSGYKYVRRAIEIIENEFPSLNSLDKLAERIHISPCYLRSLFPKLVGCRFTEYLAKTRVQKAKHLILSTDASLTNIAFDCGFGSFSSFTRAFGKYVGTSAREFKKNIENNC